MLNNLPSYIAILFGITTLLVAGLLFLAIKNATYRHYKKESHGDPFWYAGMACLTSIFSIKRVL